jgi:hypothetical protein
MMIPFVRPIRRFAASFSPDALAQRVPARTHRWKPHNWKFLRQLLPGFPPG